MSSELLRNAEEIQRNEQRLVQWRAKYALATGHEPVRCLHPVLTPREAARIAANRETNQNRLRIQRYRRQRVKGTLPAPPEIA